MTATEPESTTFDLTIEGRTAPIEITPPGPKERAVMDVELAAELPDSDPTARERIAAAETLIGYCTDLPESFIRSLPADILVDLYEAAVESIEPPIQVSEQGPAGRTQPTDVKFQSNAEHGDSLWRPWQFLTEVCGVTEEDAELLWAAGYESVGDLIQAREEEIADVKGIGAGMAARIKADVGGTDHSEKTDNHPWERPE